MVPNRTTESWWLLRISKQLHQYLSSFFAKILLYLRLYAFIINKCFFSKKEYDFNEKGKWFRIEPLDLGGCLGFLSNYTKIKVVFARKIKLFKAICL
jgi:hypothetical protein